ncbi:MAG: glycine cleavage system aminomethyltransferase GcvT [Tannerella sp.]|jgi:aminomethyltransferase|nr:glycine cleavage system aminomethyltransferase GcvT [Tannerella sp.]
MQMKTALYECHAACGGTIVPFAGYLLPVQYPTGIIAEHMAVRTAAGLFDVSHMGEIVFSGKDALKNLNNMLTNDFTSMVDDQVRYSVMCNDRGGCLDDLIVYRLNEDTFWVVVNAANKEKDFEWMKAHVFGDVAVRDISGDVAQVAIQGPRAKEIMLRLVPENMLPSKYYFFKKDVPIEGKKCLISQTGYTGEDGYEIYLSNEDAPDMWNLLLETGKDAGLTPCGLGARDTLRLEAAMPLYGHEMNDGISPLETALNFGVKMQKDDFIGKKAIEERGEPGIKRIGLKITGRGIAREHQDIYLGDTLIGQTTSGTHAPFLKYPIAMALVRTEAVETGMQVDIDVRGRRVAAEVVPLPFYKKINVN